MANFMADGRGRRRERIHHNQISNYRSNLGIFPDRRLLHQRLR
jgi:hypothetical protein